MKKISILALHLGYGGIEKCIVNLANALCENYDIEIAVCYKLYDKPSFDIDKRVKIKYLNKDIVPNNIEEKNNREIMLKCINNLKQRDKEIMVLRYGLLGSDEYTQKEVAEKLGISQSYISRIEKKVIKNQEAIMLKRIQLRFCLYKKKICYILMDMEALLKMEKNIIFIQISKIKHLLHGLIY